MIKYDVNKKTHLPKSLLQQYKDILYALNEFKMRIGNSSNYYYQNFEQYITEIENNNK